MQGEDSLKEQDLSRRKLLQVMGAATFCASFPANVVPESVSRDRDASEKSRIPKIALELSRTGSYFATGTVDEAGMRRLKQLGVNDVLMRSEEHTSELQSHSDLVCRLLLEKKKK